MRSEKNGFYQIKLPFMVLTTLSPRLLRNTNLDIKIHRYGQFDNILENDDSIN